MLDCFGKADAAMGPVGDCDFRMPTIACVVDSGMRFFRQMGVFLMSTMK